jgi:hypothetical protein
MLMLAALISGCGRSSSNDRPSGGDQIPENEAVQSIEAADVNFDECSLDDYAHAIARNEDIDNVQRAYMVMHAKAAVEHLSSIVDDLKNNEDASDSFNVLSELEQARWLDGYRSILRYINSINLPDNEARIIESVNKQNADVALKLKSLLRDQGLQQINIDL